MNQDKEINKLTSPDASTLFFTNDFPHSERASFIEKYSGKEWETALIFNDNKRNRFSRSAIKVAEVIKAKLDIDLLPLIIPVARKGFDMIGGTAAFCMYGKHGVMYLFDEPSSNYKNFRKKYYEYTQNSTNDTWIMIDNPTKK